MLRIPQAIYDDMIAHAQEGFPLEVCGLLGGSGETVSVLFRMTNTDASNEHFMMAPTEQFAVIKQLRNAGLEMLGVYHSHPETPARPSEEDIRLALTPDISYLIISLAEASLPVIKSFKIDSGTVTAEVIETIV
jgi:proteasome lid subunit RPN8/RPN11